MCKKFCRTVETSSLSYFSRNHLRLPSSLNMKHLVQSSNWFRTDEALKESLSVIVRPTTRYAFTNIIRYVIHNLWYLPLQLELGRGMFVSVYLFCLWIMFSHNNIIVTMRTLLNFQVYNFICGKNELIFFFLVIFCAL